MLNQALIIAATIAASGECFSQLSPSSGRFEVDRFASRAIGTVRSRNGLCLGEGSGLPVPFHGGRRARRQGAFAA